MDFEKKISLSKISSFPEASYESIAPDAQIVIGEPGAILNILPLVAIFIDAGGNISFINKKLLELTGYNEKEVSGKKWFEILVPGKFRSELGLLWHSLVSGQIESVENLEIPIITSRGDTLHFLWNGVTVKDENNEYQGLFIYGEDVTQLTASRLEMEGNELIFRKSVELSPQSIAILDPDFNPIYLNRKFTEIFGYTLEEVPDMGSWWDFARPDSEYHKRVYESPSQDKLLHYEKQNVVYTDELKLVCKDGSKLDIEFNLTKITDGRSLLLFKDITDIKAAQKALLLDELRLEALVELNQFTSSTTNDVLEFSLEKAVELTESRVGYIGFVDEDEKKVNVFGCSKKSNDICKIEKADTVYHFDEIGLWGEPIRQRRPVVVNDYSSEDAGKKGTPEGHIPIHNHLGIPIFDNKKIVMVAGVANKDNDYDNADIRQVTLLIEGTWKLIQRKQNEDKIKAYAEELARNNRELESLDRMKDEFMANITHELKTPLIPIKGYSELLYEGHLGLLEDDQKRGIKVVLQNASRLQKLIDSLLYMQNIRSGNIQYHLDSINIISLLNKVTDDILSIRIGDLPALRKEYDLKLPFVCGNTIYLEQVFSHILENAFKFTPSCGSITVSASKQKNSIHVMVKDTGIGISTEEMPHIFKRFYQADGSLTRRYGGNGLGLYLCKSIVEAHGGSIWAESREGKGTELHVSLPVIEE